MAMECLEDRTLPAVRFVVPLDSPADATTTFHSVHLAFQQNQAGFTNGDTIQIEPGSSPGEIFQASIRNLTNVTVRGNPLIPTAELPVIKFADAITIDAARAGFTFQNVHIVTDNTLTYTANGTLRDVLLDASVPGHAIHLNGTTAATIVNSRIVATQGGSGVTGVIGVTTVAGASNVISGNFISNRTSFSGSPALSYAGANVITDRIEHNRIDGLGPPSLLVQAGVNGLTIQDNEILGGPVGVKLDAGAQNILVRRNRITTSASGVLADATIGQTTSMTVANNVFSAGANGITFNTVGGAGGAISAKIEGNDFHGPAVGVRIDVAGGTIDLGGGALGSLGGNNFRGFTAAATASAAAILTAANTLNTTTYSAQRNLFSVANPETVIFDVSESASDADIDASNSLTGNAAFVQTLYQKFLNRSGDTSNPNDAGGWVNVLNGGASTFSVANGIARSPEASGVIVDGLFHQHLHRAPDAGSRQVFVNQLVAGFGIEFVTKEILASQEYTNYHVSDTAYVHSLFLNLLGRVPSNGEVLGFSPSPNGGNRLALADIFLFSTEYRNREVLKLYNDVLHRGASAGEVAGWVNTGLDLQSIQINFASSAEFFVNG